MCTRRPHRVLRGLAFTRKTSIENGRQRAIDFHAFDCSTQTPLEINGARHEHVFITCAHAARIAFCVTFLSQEKHRSKFKWPLSGDRFSRVRLCRRKQAPLEINGARHEYVFITCAHVARTAFYAAFFSEEKHRWKLTAFRRSIFARSIMPSASAI